MVLPAALWPKVLRENHDSIFSCHLRTPQTLARIAVNYWWPDMRTYARQSCRDCGSRKSKAKEVLPPLRSQDVRNAGDTWALDVAGPLPVTAGGNRYVVVAVDYTTRYAVVAAVPSHAAKDNATFIVEKMVLVYGPMREIAKDGAPELNGAVENEVGRLATVEASHDRPALLGLVERFHRT